MAKFFDWPAVFRVVRAQLDEPRPIALLSLIILAEINLPGNAQDYIDFRQVIGKIEGKPKYLTEWEWEQWTEEYRIAPMALKIEDKLNDLITQLSSLLSIAQQTEIQVPDDLSEYTNQISEFVFDPQGEFQQSFNQINEMRTALSSIVELLEVAGPRLQRIPENLEPILADMTENLTLILDSVYAIRRKTGA